MKWKVGKVAVNKETSKCTNIGKIYFKVDGNNVGNSQRTISKILRNK